MAVRCLKVVMRIPCLMPPWTSSTPHRLRIVIQSTPSTVCPSPSLVQSSENDGLNLRPLLPACQQSATEVDQSETFPTPPSRRPLYSPKRVIFFLCKLCDLLVFGLFVIFLLWVACSFVSPFAYAEIARFCWKKGDVGCVNSYRGRMWK